MEITPHGPASYEAFIEKTRQEPELADLVRESDVTINIEGAAFRDDGSLILGLRYPLAADGKPVLVDPRRHRTPLRRRNAGGAGLLGGGRRRTRRHDGRS